MSGTVTAARGDMVYDLWTTDGQNRDNDTQAALIDFLGAHGINAAGFPIGNRLTVHRRDDGTLWLHTWRAVGNDLRTAPVCESCPSCIAQEQVVVPLAAVPPLLPSAFFSPEFRADLVAVGLLAE